MFIKGSFHEKSLREERSNASMMAIFFIILMVLAIPDEALSKAKKVKAPSTGVCRYVAEFANRGQLKKIIIPSDPVDSSAVRIPNSVSYGTVFKRMLDINNDGVPERVVITSGGTAHFERYSIFGSKTDEEINIEPSPEDDWEEDNLRWAFDRAFIRYRGLVYVLGKTDQTLQYLEYISPQNRSKVICEFDQKSRHYQRLKSSRNHRVCGMAQAGKLKPVTFDKLHALSHRALQAAEFYETHAGDRAALIDINNDGKKEVVVSLELSSGRGRGCGGSFLGVLTADRTAIDRQLTERLPAGGCGGQTVTPFMVDGRIYLDERQDGPFAEHRQIYMLDRDKLRTICKFEVRPVNYVLTALGKIQKMAKSKDMNPWKYALSRPGTAAVTTLIRAGRDVNEVLDDYNLLPIDIVLQDRRDDLLELLLKAGANPNLKSSGQYPDSFLAEAVDDGNIKAVTLLLKYGAKDSDSAVSALCNAIWKGSPEMVELLLRSGIMISDTAAIEAVQSSNKDRHRILNLLLKNRLDVRKGYTKDVVIQGIRQEGLNTITVGPDIKTQTVTKTILEWAKEANDPETIRSLIASGAK